MKKISLSLMMVLLTATVIFAQKANPQALLSKLEKSNAEIQDPKKAEKASTWLSRGDLLFEIATANTGIVFEGMSESESALLIGKPLSDQIPIVTIGGTDFKKYSFSVLNVYFTMDGKAAMWEDTKPIMEGALDKALEAYRKAAQLDPKSAAKAKDGIKRVIQQLKIDGQNLYSLGNYKGAAEVFSRAGTASADPLIGTVDNEIMYFAGVSAIQGDDFEKGADYLQKALSGGYEADGLVYYYLGFAKNKIGDAKGAEEVLLQGVAKYPASQDILSALISHYISNNDDPNKVIPYIKTAQQNDPSNVVLYIAEGVAYESMKDFVKAEAAYNMAIEKDPKFFDPYYNLGLMYNIKGEDAVDELRSINYTDRKAYTAKEDEAIAYFKRAAELFEKAHQLKPEDRNTIQLLRTLYFRLRDEGPEMQANYEKYNALYNQL